MSTHHPPFGSSANPGHAAPIAQKPWEHAKAEGGSGSDPLAARFVESLSYDTRLYDADIRGSLAHANMLRQVGLLTLDELTSIEHGLGEIRAEIEGAAAGPGGLGSWQGWRTELEDVHMCIEAALIAKVGDAGRKLHTGRSRNDQVALDLRLWLRDACGLLAGALDGALAALAGLAERQGHIVMPGYTHMQRAQPICLGGELAAWHAMLSRDARSLRGLAADELGLGLSPLGSGAVAGSSLPLDRAHTARALGFAGASSSSIDATASRDEALDFLYMLSRTAMHLSRWAEQWILYCTSEFGFIVLDERYTTGSSMMPQKRNPDMLELIRGRCGNIYGHLAALLTICKGLPIAYNRDLQEDKRHVFGAFDMAMDCIHMAARIMGTASFREEHIASTLHRGYLDATSLAEYLVTKGVPFRTAHQIVGSLVRQCEREGRESLERLSHDELEAAVRGAGIKGGKVGRDVAGWLGAAAVVGRYRSSGNAGRGDESGYQDYFGAVSVDRDLCSMAVPGGTGRVHSRPGEHEPHAAEGGAVASLFGGASEGPNDASDLGRLYERIGRTLDDLPYTQEMEQIFAESGAGERGWSRAELLHKLQNLRKAGKLARVGRAAASPIKLTAAEESQLETLVVESVGSLGQRDQLPHTPEFDRIVEVFNQRTGRGLTPHGAWRLVAKLAK
ncbi:MAG: argininosuccinate lyase [Phycisphaerales bacterium]|nr:argininosuccinate lyase [Phycisphaerales bacterium]